MGKIRFAIEGTGWRAGYYLRIAKLLSSRFELVGMVSRSEERAKALSGELEINVTADKDSILAANVDFVVIAAKKDLLFELGKYWLGKGVPVVLETPAGMDEGTLREIEGEANSGAKIYVAEQYFRYPQILALTSLIKSGKIGNPEMLFLSYAHEYHGYSIARALLEPKGEVTIKGERHEFDITRTLTRNESYTDGVTVKKPWDHLTLQWEDGKVCYFDFCPEEYRSPICTPEIKIQGDRGLIRFFGKEIAEISTDRVAKQIVGQISYLNEENRAVCEPIIQMTRIVKTGEENPNWSEYQEIMDIRVGADLLYYDKYGMAGLSADETAIAQVLEDAGEFVKTGNAAYPVQLALEDARVAMKMRELQ